MNSKMSFVLLIVPLLAACGSPPAISTDAPQPQSPSLTQPQPTSVPPTSTPAPTEIPAPSQPADPQRIEFEAEDGVKLVGYYYPAAIEPAPVLVLMHWAGGMNCDWLGVNLIQWAQNRGLAEGADANPVCTGAKIHVTFPLAEYPPLPTGQSFAVFAFDYRGYGESEGGESWNPSGYLNDSIAAMQTARNLPGADPEQIAAIGASIGADGAIDGCGEGCLGALSLSPGNYLGVNYADAVNKLGEEQKPAWCVASKTDKESFPVCDGAGGEFFEKFIFDQNGHGMSYFDSDFDPSAAEIILDFLQAVYGG